MILEQISGIGEWTKELYGEKGEGTLYKTPNGKVFLVERPKTLELRTDRRLGEMLREKYESVMESRYFGRGGIEIVPSGQLDEAEVMDLVRLSYNLSKEVQHA